MVTSVSLDYHELASNGVNPREEEIAAIRDARPPKDASEMRLFMDLVQYCAKLMPDVASVAKPVLLARELYFTVIKISILPLKR